MADTTKTAPALPLLAAEHQGMRVDYIGLLWQCRQELEQNAPGYAEMLRQMQEHLRELGQRWYAGDVAVVDEMLQLYCIEKDARKAAQARLATTDALKGEAKPGQAPAQDAAATVPAWKLERMRHIANEWADMATNGPQWLKNIRDGISTVPEALAALEKDYAHCRAVNDAPGLYGAATPPVAPQATAEQEHDDTEDMAAVGRALMQAIETCRDSLEGWSPMDCPSEIVADLINQRDEARAAPTAPQAVPLTDAQIDGLPWHPQVTVTEGLRDFAREVERAHGIGTTVTKEQSKSAADQSGESVEAAVHPRNPYSESSRLGAARVAGFNLQAWADDGEDCRRAWDEGRAARRAYTGAGDEDGAA